MTATLFGESGQREERVEWGIRATKDRGWRRKGHVEAKASEESARFCLTDEAISSGYRHCELVSRTVVTHTTQWETR